MRSTYDICDRRLFVVASPSYDRRSRCFKRFLFALHLLQSSLNLFIIIVSLTLDRLSHHTSSGFAGHQLPTSTPPPVDIYTPSTNSWETVIPSGDPHQGYPGARSVHGLVPLSTPDGTGVALLYHGEHDASSLGHAGAGEFWDDVWALLRREGALEWRKLIVEGESNLST